MSRDPDPAAHDPYQALRYGEYRWFLAGALALTMATQIQTLVMGWQAPAIGAVLMSFWLAHHPPGRAGLMLLFCVAGFGLCWIGFALSFSFWVSLTLLALSGAMDNVSVVLRGTLVQTLTPPDMMGRVQAVSGFFIGSSNELGAFESGLAARLLGVVPSVVMGGCMTLGIVGFTGWKVPELRELKHF